MLSPSHQTARLPFSLMRWPDIPLLVWTTQIGSPSEDQRRRMMSSDHERIEPSSWSMAPSIALVCPSRTASGVPPEVQRRRVLKSQQHIDLKRFTPEYITIKVTVDFSIFALFQLDYGYGSSDVTPVNQLHFYWFSIDGNTLQYM